MKNITIKTVMVKYNPADIFNRKLFGLPKWWKDGNKKNRAVHRGYSRDS